MSLAKRAFPVAGEEKVLSGKGLKIMVDSNRIINLDVIPQIVYRKEQKRLYLTLSKTENLEIDGEKAERTWALITKRMRYVRV